MILKISIANIMDLNVNNYTCDDLLSILRISSEKQLTVDLLQDALLKKMDMIKITDGALPETKENLMSFFTRSFFKIVNDRELYKDNNDSVNILVRDDLLPALSENIVVGPNAVTPHSNDIPVSTWNTNLRAGVINPLKRKSFKKILNVNTRFRDNYNTTKSTDFQLTLPYPVKKVTSLKLVNSEFPKTVYSFSSILGSNNFQVASPIGGAYDIIDISSGSYSTAGIVTTINQALSDESIDVSLNYNANDGKMTFSGPLPFDLKFDYIETNICPLPRSNVDSEQLTLGWMLGFRGNTILPKNAVQVVCPCGQLKNTTYIKRQKWPPPLSKKKVCIYNYAHDVSNIYTDEDSYTGEGIFDGHGTSYFLLSVDDFQNNHNEVFISPFKDQTLGDNNILAKINTGCCGGSCCGDSIERIYFGPVDLIKLHFKLLDEFGRIIDINNSDYSFTLEMELLYDL
jgi:hypothetical protein